jgi:hypothetical protein
MGVLGLGHPEFNAVMKHGWDITVSLASHLSVFV